MSAVATTYRYGTCRLLGHQWHVVPSDWTPRYGEAMTTRCERCDIERRDEINRNTGEVESRRYSYPDGYLFSRDTDDERLPSRVDFRLLWLDGAISEQRERRNAQRRNARANAADREARAEARRTA